MLTSKDGGEGAAGGAGAPSKAAQAKALLARYGSAYLITSISFAIVSMTACYLAVDAGVDVAGLLQRVGLQVRQLEAARLGGPAAGGRPAPRRAPPDA